MSSTEDDIRADDRVLPNGQLNRIYYAKLLREAAGATARDWVMSVPSVRRKIHNRGRMRLVHAGGMTMAEWRALPALSRARSRVLLRGARKLGIPTEWKGWK